MVDGKSDLLTLDASDPGSIYSRALEAVVKITGGVGVFFRAVETKGELYYDGIQTCATTPGESDVLEDLNGRPLLTGPTLKVQQPESKEISRFVRIPLDERFDGTEVKRVFLEPFGLREAIRIQIYDGGKFVGQLGSYRRLGSRGLTETRLRELNGLAASICTSVSAAHRLLQQRLPTKDHHITLSPSGQIECASVGAKDLLTGSRRERLRQAVANLEKGATDDAEVPLDGLQARVARLEGRGMYQYLVILKTPRYPRRDPLSPLTPTQREVATYAANGATAAEIAATMDRSPHTTKTHLKNIYDRLGIGSRAELAMLMEQSRGDADE